jgi:hypothetical protein
MKNDVFWDVTLCGSEERSASIITVTRIGERETLAVTSNRRTLRRTDVSEESSASIIGVTRIGELGTTLAVTCSRRTLRRNTKQSASVASDC